MSALLDEKNARIKELELMADELLEMYRQSQVSVIWEYSGTIQADLNALKIECQGYSDRIGGTLQRRKE